MNNGHVYLEPLCSTSERGEKLLSDDAMRQIAADISSRIIEAFHHLPDSEITFLLKTDSATVKTLIEGEQLPSTEMLLCIHKVTGVSIDWILTGKGANCPNSVEFFIAPRAALSSAYDFKPENNNAQLASGKL
jgi:hypothetical protein